MFGMGYLIYIVQLGVWGECILILMHEVLVSLHLM